MGNVGRDAWPVKRVLNSNVGDDGTMGFEVSSVGRTAGFEVLAVGVGWGFCRGS